MISAYNRKETALALLCAVGALMAYACAFFFFCFAFSFATGVFSLVVPYYAATGFGTFALIAISISGFLTWRAGEGFRRFEQSGLDFRLDETSAEAFFINRYTGRVTGPAWLLSQVFLGGPLLALGALVHFKNRLPHEPGLEEDLQRALRMVQEANKWQSLNDYISQRREILLLARMGKIDFSAAKGVPRLRSR